MNEINREIIRKLQKDGRKSFRKLAKELNLAPATMASRVRKLEKDGIIMGYSAKVNHLKLDEIMALIEIFAKGDQWKNLEKWIGEKKEVSLLAAVSGESDLILLGSFESIHHLNSFVTELLSTEGIVDTNTRTIFRLSKKQI